MAPQRRRWAVQVWLGYAETGLNWVGVDNKKKNKTYFFRSFASCIAIHPIAVALARSLDSSVSSHSLSYLMTHISFDILNLLDYRYLDNSPLTILFKTSPLLPPSTDGAPPLRGATHAALGSGWNPALARRRLHEWE